MTEFLLEVYDLSHGMATCHKQSILGMRIDGIWHTGVLIFNKEAVVFNVLLLAILPRGSD